MSELDVGLVDEGELNYNQSFVKFNVRKECRQRVILDLTLNAEY